MYFLNEDMDKWTFATLPSKLPVYLVENYQIVMNV